MRFLSNKFEFLDFLRHNIGCPLSHPTAAQPIWLFNISWLIRILKMITLFIDSTADDDNNIYFTEK